MALPVLENRTPITMRVVSINLESVLSQSEPDGDWDTENKSANFTLQVLDQDGTPMPAVGGELLQHLTPEQIAYQIQFLNDMRALAEAALPPAP